MAFRSPAPLGDNNGMTAVMDRPIQAPRWRNPRTLAMAGVAAAGLLAIALGVVAVGGGARPSMRVPAAAVTLSTAEPGLFHDTVVMRATAAPKDVIYLDALEGGQVQAVL